MTAPAPRDNGAVAPQGDKPVEVSPRRRDDPEHEDWRGRRPNGYDGGGGGRNNRPNRSEVVSGIAVLLAAGSFLSLFTFGQTQMDRVATAAIAPLAQAIQSVNAEHKRLEREIVRLQADKVDKQLRDEMVLRLEALIMANGRRLDQLAAAIDTMSQNNAANTRARFELLEEDSELRRRLRAVEDRLGVAQRSPP